MSAISNQSQSETPFRCPLVDILNGCYTANNMNRIFADILFISFASIALCGFSAMNHNGGNNHSGCIAAITQGENCLRVNDILSFAAFHLNTFKSFSEAVFNKSASVMLFLFAILAIGAALALIRGISPGKLNFTSNRYNKSLALFISPSEEQIMRWLSLRENSPSFS